MAKFIGVTDRYGRSDVIFINVDSIESIGLLMRDEDDAKPPVEITTHHRTFYVNESISEIMKAING